MPLAGVRLRLPAWRRWVRRLSPVLFAVALVAAAVVTVLAPPQRSAARPPLFSHVYPADPTTVERPKVSAPLPIPPPANTLSGRQTVGSFAALSAVLPRGVLSPLGRGNWRLTRAAAVGAGTSLDVRGPGSLEIAPGAFLESIAGGSIDLRDLRILGVDAQGRPLATPSPGRGFVVAVGGRLWLQNDALSDLGHLAVLAYGVAMREPAAGSGVIDTTIDGNYIGVYLTHAVSVRIAGNQISHSVVYGIDPHTESSGLLIENNHVIDSGVHGIILADRVTGTTIRDNTVDGAKDHGIVLFDHSDRNVVVDNHVAHTFDGIAVTDSSSNRISGNVVDAAVRFGLRVSGASVGNVFTGNVVTGALVGAYVYAGARGTQLIDNVFAGDREEIRVRSDAPGTRVSPLPPRSEVPA